MAKSNVLTRSKKKKALVHFQKNEYREAKLLLDQICKIDRMDADAWSMLGVVNGELENLSEAENCFRKVTTLQPTNIEALTNLGVILEKLHRPDEAIDLYKKATQLKPNDANLYFWLADTLSTLDRFDEAIEFGLQFTKLAPDNYEGHVNLGFAYMQAQRNDQAIEIFRRAIELDSEGAVAHLNLGQVLDTMGNLEQAIEHYQRAVQLKPDFSEACNNLGFALQRQGELEESVKFLRHAVEIDPNNFYAYNNLGLTLRLQGNTEESLAAFGQAIKLNPQFADAYNHQGNALLTHARPEEAFASYRRAVENNCTNPKAYRNLLFTLNYLPEYSTEVLYQEHQKWAETQAPQLGSPPVFPNRPDVPRRLRVGYVSPDMQQHSVAYFFEPILANHDSNDFDIYCYAEVKKADEVTERLQYLAGHWRDTVGKTDEQLVEMIRSDGIDILVDLAGHTSNSRLPVFGYQPAPIQVSYLGYPNTTGMPTMDYRITDQWADPVGQERYYIEQLLNLEHGFLCYRPPTHCPSVSNLPVKENGYITFGSFNNLCKVTPVVVALWSRILNAIPGARLIMKNKSFRDPSVRERYASWFHEHGIAAERIEFIAWLPEKLDHFKLYNRIDIALDTFPYNGTTTTCEALWMGVPVITLAGDRHAGRVGVSLLSNLGLSEWIAADEEKYVEVAVKNANATDQLAQQRETLRERMAHSSLCDEQEFVRALENVYQQVWEKWCEKDIHSG